MSLSQADIIALQPLLDATAKAISQTQLGVALSRADETGPVIWLSADFRSLLASTGINFRLAGELAEYLVDAVLRQAGVNASVVVSAFNFDFPRTHCFNVATTAVQTGAFGQQLLKRHPEQRTAHPFYSFLVYGKAQQQLLNLPTTAPLLRHSTGPGSIFEWLITANTELITIGHHYVKSLTAVHHAEHIVGVPFRYTKHFEGIVRFASGEQYDQQKQDIINNSTRHHSSDEAPITCAFYVRDLGVCDFSSLTERGDLAFRQAQLVHVHPVTAYRRPLLVHHINLAKAHSMMVADLQKDQSTYIDYFGPNRPNVDVITSKRADALYHAELKTLQGQHTTQ